MASPVLTTNICLLTNFTELELTTVQANHRWGQMRCGRQPNIFLWEWGEHGPVAPDAAPPMSTSPVNSFLA